MHKNRWLPITVASATAGLLLGALLVPLTRVSAQAPFAPPPPVPAGPVPPRPGPPPGMVRFPPPAQLMSATDTHVYVLRGNTLFQFSARDLKLLHKATLDVEQPRRTRVEGGTPEPRP